MSYLMVEMLKAFLLSAVTTAGYCYLHICSTLCLESLLVWNDRKESNEALITVFAGLPKELELLTELNKAVRYKDNTQK